MKKELNPLFKGNYNRFMKKLQYLKMCFSLDEKEKKWKKKQS